MDCKTFIQLVEEKKRRALEKKEAPLKWEQKLEAAAKAKAKADAEAKARRVKAAESHRHKSDSDSDSECDSDSSGRGHKLMKRAHKKHRKHTYSDLDDWRREKKSKRRPRRHSSASDESSDDYYENSSEDRRRRRKHISRRHKWHQSRSNPNAVDVSGDEGAGKRKTQRKHHKCRKSSESSCSVDYSFSSDDHVVSRKKHKHHHRSRFTYSDYSSDERGPRRKNSRKHHKRRQRSHSGDWSSSDSDVYKRRKSADANCEDADGMHMKHKKCSHDDHQQRRSDHLNSGQDRTRFDQYPALYSHNHLERRDNGHRAPEANGDHIEERD